MVTILNPGFFKFFLKGWSHGSSSRVTTSKHKVKRKEERKNERDRGKEGGEEK
jgi:hypothetical protein